MLQTKEIALIQDNWRVGVCKRGGGTNIAQQYLFTYKIANQF